MGYRSDVAGAFTVDGRYMDRGAVEQAKYINKCKEMIGLIKLSKFYELMNRYENEDDSKFMGWKDGQFVFYGQGWKWYSDYDFVIAWKELWEMMQEVEDISGVFVRVGEETDDIEEDNFGDDVDFDMCYPRTELAFGGGSILGKRETGEDE